MSFFCGWVWGREGGDGGCVGGVTVGHDPAVPDTHQFEMQWMKLLLLLGEHSLLHPLAKTLLICY